MRCWLVVPFRTLSQLRWSEICSGILLGDGSVHSQYERHHVRRYVVTLLRGRNRGKQQCKQHLYQYHPSGRNGYQVKLSHRSRPSIHISLPTHSRSNHHDAPDNILRLFSDATHRQRLALQSHIPAAPQYLLRFPIRDCLPRRA